MDAESLNKPIELELKHKEITEAQLLNYLRATAYEVGLLLNFGIKPDFRRKVYSNERKSITWK